MARTTAWIFLIGVVAAQSSVPVIPSTVENPVSVNTYIQGAGVVAAGSKQNYLQFTFKANGAVEKGDEIGFYIYDDSKTSADISNGNEYACDGTKTPLLSISPSVEFNTTAFEDARKAGITTTPFFGGLAQGRYKLCYCKKPEISDANPAGECRTNDYKLSVGVYFFYDVPELKQKRAVFKQRQFGNFVFNIKNLASTDTNQRVIISDLKSSTPTVSGYAGSRGCSDTTNWFSGNPEWAADTSADSTTAKIPLSKVRTFHDYQEVSFNTQSGQFGKTDFPTGFYSVCLCDVDGIGGATDCSTECAISGSCSQGSQKAPIEIATVFVHDLSFLILKEKAFSVSVAQGSTNSFFLDYKDPAYVWAEARFMWFGRSSLPCVAGNETSFRTSSVTFPTTGVAFALTFPSVSTPLFDPLRLCVSLQDKTVLPVDNVVLHITEIDVAMHSLADKISDNNQIGLKPESTSVVGKYQASVAKESHGVWLSENFLGLTMTWTSSVSNMTDVYAVKSSHPCDTIDGASRTSAATIFDAGLKQANLTLDLGSTLHSVKTITPSENAALADQLVAPVSSASNSNYTLFSDYKLCATCHSCSGTGTEVAKFRVLAALHVYEPTGFGKSYRFNSWNQEIIIASGVVPSNPSLLFQTTDTLWFSDASYPCFDVYTTSAAGNVSSVAMGNQTVFSTTFLFQSFCFECPLVQF